jgi:hypothetical protein
MGESTHANSGTAGSGTRKNGENRADASAQQSSRRNGDATSGSGDLAAQGRDIAGQAQAQAENLVSTAREQATSRLTTQKTRAAEGLTAVAGALQAASREMRSQDNSVVADYIDTAAGQVDQFARALNDQDISQLIKTTEQFARRQPALFLAAAFALGFAGTRFLKSSSQAAGRMPRSDSYWQSQDRSGWQASGSSGSRSPSSWSEERYGSDLGFGDEARFSGDAGSRSTQSEWQIRTGFNSGPEGQ